MIFTCLMYSFVFCFLFIGLSFVLFYFSPNQKERTKVSNNLCVTFIEKSLGQNCAFFRHKLIK